MVDVNARHAPVVAETSVPAVVYIFTLPHFLAPACEDDEMELADPLAAETQLVVLAVAIRSECIGDAYVGLSAVDADAAHLDRIKIAASY